MIDITHAAREILTSFLSSRKIPLKVRVTFPPGCGGDLDQLILVPDQPATGDISVDFGPLTLCMDRDLFEQVGRVRVDYRDAGYDYGFVIECERPPFDGGGCSGCTACV